MHNSQMTTKSMTADDPTGWSIIESAASDVLISFSQSQFLEIVASASIAVSVKNGSKS